MNWLQRTGAAALVVLLALISNMRASLYDNDVALWTDTAFKSPSKARPLYNLGLALVREKRYEEALLPLHRALTIDPYDLQGLKTIAIAYYDLGMYAEAEWYYRRIVELKPRSQMAQFAGSMISLMQGTGTADAKK